MMQPTNDEKFVMKLPECCQSGEPCKHVVNIDGVTKKTNIGM